MSIARERTLQDLLRWPTAVAVGMASLAPSPAFAADSIMPSLLIAIVALGIALVAMAAYLMASRRVVRQAAADPAPPALAALTENGDLGVLVVDGDGKERSIGLARVLGADGEPTRAALLAALKPANSPDPLDQALDRMLAEGVPFEADCVAGENPARHVLVRGRMVTLPTGRSAGVVSVRDISSVRAATDDASAAVAAMRSVFDSLPMPIWCRDRTLAIIDCNKRYAAVVEVNSVDQAIKECREIAPIAIPEDGKALAREARDIGTPLSQRHHVVIDGSRRLLEITEAPLPGTSRLIGFALDLTSQEGIEVDRDRHIAAHREVLEHLANAVAIYGPDKKLKFFNSAFVNLWALDGEMLYGEPKIGEILEYLRENRRLPEFADFPTWKADQERQFTSLIDPVEDLMHLPDGRTLRTLTTPHPMGGLLFLYEDVTDRLALERSYNTLIAVQRETLDNLHEAVAVVGADGRLKLHNPAFARLWDLSEGYLTGEPHIGDVVESARRFIETGDWGRFKENVVGRMTDRNAHSGRLDRSDDIVLDYAFVPLPDGGTLLSYTDVSDTVRVERALRERAEALETTDRLKTEFLTNVSYELRTPLNTIIGFAEILSHLYRGDLNERQREYVDGILTSSAELLSLIDNILDLAMIEAGRMSLDLTSVELPRMLSEVHSLANQWARGKGLSVSLNVPDGLGVINADERRLKQALMNLVSNAVAFTPEGGRITISAKAADTGISFSVADSGVGIAEGDQERVFEKFEHAGSGRERGHGVGLGLALVKQIVMLHGGGVELESTPGAGTTVTCLIPRTPPASMR